MKQFTLIMIICCLFSVGIAWGNDTKTSLLTTVTTETGGKSDTSYSSLNTTAKMLYDSRTGHKYIKTDENSYSEFSKRGKYLKTVPADLPLLASNRGIHPITEDTFILYKKGGCLDKEYTLLPGLKNHPAGCQSVKVLVALE